jgi:peptide/nickel transport system permease protein
VRAVVSSIATLLVISIVTFAACNLKSPSDTARDALGRGVAPVQIQAFVRAHDLDQPVVIRYGHWLGNFVQGDWGKSPVTGIPVRANVVPRLQNTLTLALLALLVAIPPSIAIGLAAARRGAGPLDLTVTGLSVAIAAVPEFVVGTGLILLFAVWLHVLPVDSTGLFFGSSLDGIKSYVLPVMTLAIVLMPQFVRMTRAVAGDIVATPYVRAAFLRGLAPRTVMWRHVLPNSAGTLANVISVNVVWLISGVIVVENVFQFPGIGQLLVSAVAQSDVLTVETVTVVMGAVFVAVALLADLAAAYFEPRDPAGQAVDVAEDPA